MAGDDEARARATLLEMQTRIGQGPHIVLGVAELASADQVRAAFLELTKQFHPARFGRMSPDVQRISNEVFLGIKAAHETMLRALGAPLKPTRAAKSGGFAPIAAEGSAGTRTSAARTGPVPLAPRPTSRIPHVGSGSPSGQVGGRGAHPGAPRSSTPAFGTPVARTSTPAARPATPASARPGTPPRSIATRTTDSLDPGTLRYAGVQPAGSGAQGFDEQAALDHALTLLQDRDWSTARVALHALAARVPQSKPYRALLCYARGREAQAAGKSEDAALEFQRALQLDPDLGYAKMALAEVQRRR